MLTFSQDIGAAVLEPVENCAEDVRALSYNEGMKVSWRASLRIV